MSNNIEGKVVVITGASSSLGEATARCFPRRTQALYWARGASSGLKSLADKLTGRGGKALPVVANVADCEQVKKLVDTAVRTHERIDVLINNAGLMPQSPLERLEIEEWNRMINVNINGVLYALLWCFRI